VQEQRPVVRGHADRLDGVLRGSANYEDCVRAVMEHVVADTSEEERADLAAAARAENDEVVLAVGDPVDELGPATRSARPSPRNPSGTDP
jgi:hypothetical protein